MPKCKNYDAYYTGKEKSPRGLGYHAMGEKIGYEEIGNDNKIWHVIEFGKNKIKRWIRKRANTSKYININDILHIKAFPLKNIGLCNPGMSPYNENAWSCYSYKILTPTSIQIIKNDIDIPMKPMLKNDFVELYKTVHGKYKFGKN